MKKTLLIIFASFFFLASNGVSAAGKSRIYAIDIRYDGGEVTIGDITIKDGYPSIYDENSLPADKAYRIELRSFTDQILEQIKFDISTTVMPPPPLEGDLSTDVTPIKLEETAVIINLLYHKDGKTLVLYSSANDELERADIGYLADVCGDKICQPHESFESCAKDCTAAGKDDYCNPALKNTDPDCLKTEPAAATTAAAEKKPPSGTYVLYTVGGTVIIITFIGSVLFLRKRKTVGISTDENRINDDK
jgi:hypothetical protein